MTLPASRSILTSALGALLLIWSVSALAIDAILARPYREIAGQIEARRATIPDRKFFDDVERAIGGEDVLPLCSRDIVRSAVTIKLAKLETTYRYGQPEELGPALSAAKSTLERALHCMPNDGNLWLRLAIVNFTARGPAGLVEEQLKKSFAAAPGEGWIVMSRLAFAVQARVSPGLSLEQLVETNARNLVNYARPSELANFYVKASKDLRSVLDNYIAEAGQDRRMELRQAISYAAETSAPRD